LSRELDVPLLRQLAPDLLRFGLELVVEFEPHSLWYETSLTIAAQALRNQVKTDYHTFQHIPSEIRENLAQFGLNVHQLEQGGLLRVLDTYTVTTAIGSPERPKVGRQPYESQSIKLSDWSLAAMHDLKSPHEIPDAEKRRLHIDDNTSVLLQYNSEKEMIDYWRTRFIAWTRARELIMVHSIVPGVYSDSFYRQLETLMDGIIDFRSQEKDEKLEHQVRVRMIRGKNYDSSWRKLRLLENGEVALT